MGPKSVDVIISLADSVSGLRGMVAVLAALRVAEQTGAGQHIDLSMFEAEVLGRWMGMSPERVGELERSAGLYPCERVTVSEGKGSS
ncbi:MAG: CoA transferase [Actinomycetota bacterium]|nr:CoA transferase [Actinomycetota bacterium]